MPAEGRENPLLKKGNSDAFFREKYLTKNNSPDEWGNQLSDEKECYGKLDGIRRRLTTGFTVLIEKA